MIEVVQRVVKIRYRLAVSPTASCVFRGHYRVVYCVLGFVAPTKVKGQQFCNFVGAIGIQLFERVSDSAVESAAMALKQASVYRLLRQRVSKYINSLFS